VYYFLKNNVPIGIIVEVREGDKSFEISAVAVNIADCNQAASGGQRD
jgi:hypothetical protein